MALNSLWGKAMRLKCLPQWHNYRDWIWSGSENHLSHEFSHGCFSYQLIIVTNTSFTNKNTSTKNTTTYKSADNDCIYPYRVYIKTTWGCIRYDLTAWLTFLPSSDADCCALCAASCSTCCHSHSVVCVGDHIRYVPWWRKQSLLSLSLTWPFYIQVFKQYGEKFWTHF